MKNVLEYLEEAARKWPDKKAVGDLESSLTFSELRDRSRQMAAHPSLKENPGTAIGVVADNKCEVLLYFMAVLYSRHYYVPIDPDIPLKKLNSILENAEIDLVLGAQGREKILKEADRKTHFLSVSDFPAEAAAEIPLSTDPDLPAYMIYTSGSTGVPKGVLKSHGSIISFIDAYTETFGFDSSEVIGNQTPFFFDASTKDIYLMLKTGATMELLPAKYFATPVLLINYMNDKKVSFISWVPSALSVIVQLNTFKAVLPEYLKKVFFVGEVMPMKHLNKWREALPDIHYVNLYGQTEIAGICCYYDVQKAFANDENLPMGKSLSNCDIFLLDPEGKVIREPGKIGEMYLCSPALALEYYKDPEKTASCFLTMDFGDGIFRRAFKTGDLAQYDAEGNLVFASRSDYQIKHMGHRIELGEIETVAGALEGIDRCCCLYNSDKNRIVLFCQLAPGCTMTGRDIQIELRNHLSSYMVPNRVNILEEMPFNANRKIDRQKLKELL